MPHHEMSGSLPLLIVPLLVDTIREEMDKNEGFLGLPKGNGSSDAWPSFTGLRTLEAMSLVHKGWTAAAQAALRRRIFLSADSLQGFMNDTKACGPWVRELQYWDVGFQVDMDSKKGEQTASSLSRLFDKLSGLVALSLGNKFQINWSLVIAPSLSSATRLRALHIRCIFQAPGLSLVLEAVANLHNLEVLSLIGIWEVLEDDEEDEDSRSWSLPPILARLHPPPTLKRLHLDSNFGPDAIPNEDLLSWILRARGDYALQDLRLIVTYYDEGEEDLKYFGRILLNSVASTLPFLERLLLGDNTSIDVDICKELLSRCTSLRELHLYLDFEHELPRSVERFCYGHDDDRPKHLLPKEDEFLSNYLLSLSSLDEAPNLAFVCHYIGRAKMENRKTQEACAALGIEYVPGCMLEGTW